MYYIKAIFIIIMNKLEIISHSKEYRENLNLFNKRKYIELIKSSKLLEETEELDSAFYQRLAIAYLELDYEEQANITMKKSLKLFTNKDLNLFIKEIQDLIFNKSKIKSKYIYLGGYSNLGAIIHTDIKNSKVEYITKVSKKYTNKIYNIEKEIIFNDIIRSKIPLLQKITPELIFHSDYKYKKLKIMTFEKKGENLRADSNVEFNKVIELNNSINDSINYDEAYRLLKKNKSEKHLKNCIEIHNKSTHLKIHDDMIKKISINDKNKETINKIDEVYELIIDYKIYNEVRPDRDYVFCHGDFGPHNITYDKNSNKYFVIDWETYGFNLKGHDIASYLVESDIEFTTIKQEYLPKIFPFGEREVIEKFFLIYQLSIKMVNNLKKDNYDYDIKYKVMPTLNYLKLIIEEFIEIRKE